MCKRRRTKCSRWSRNSLISTNSTNLVRRSKRKRRSFSPPIRSSLRAGKKHAVRSGVWCRLLREFLPMREIRKLQKPDGVLQRSRALFLPAEPRLRVKRATERRRPRVLVQRLLPKLRSLRRKSVARQNRKRQQNRPRKDQRSRRLVPRRSRPVSPHGPAGETAKLCK